MTELTSFMLERLWEDGELVLFRGKRDAGLARVLVVAPALEQPVPETIARLRHAYSLATKVDPAWAVRASERNCGLALRSTWSDLPGRSDQQDRRYRVDWLIYGTSSCVRT